jgi:transposase
MQIKVVKMLEARLLKEQGMKQIHIADHFGVTERTIRNWLSDLENPEKLKVLAPLKRKTKLDPFKEVVKNFVINDPHCNCELVFEKIKLMGYLGQISRLRDYMAIIRREELSRIALTFETLPAQQAQVDWKECGKFDLGNGQKTKIYAFVMILGYSRRTFVHLTTSMNSANVLACHQKAFEYFGGVPKEILYDNMKTAFIFNGSEWYVNPKLRAFAAECGFKARRCKIYCPWTKGKVERFNGFISRNLLPRLERENQSLDELNQQVTAWVQTQVDPRIIQAFGESRMDRFAREKELLGALSEGLDISEIHPVMVRNDSTIQYNNVRYTVPPRYVFEMLELRISVLDNQARLFHQGQIIRTFQLTEPSKLRRVEFAEDIQAIREIWKEQEQKRFARREREIAQKRIQIPESDIRHPSLYDQIIEDVA